MLDVQAIDTRLNLSDLETEKKSYSGLLFLNTKKAKLSSSLKKNFNLAKQ